MNKIIASPTPMMKQWQDCKEQMPDALLFFRLGDFYEAFCEDAVTLAQELNLTLTKRQQIPMSGIPVTQLENYLDRLLAKGYKVAVAEQLEDPKQTKSLVKRKIVRAYTKGSVLCSSLLKEKENNYLCHLYKNAKGLALAWADVTTARLQIERGKSEEILARVSQVMPSEILISKELYSELDAALQQLQLSFSFVLFVQEESFFRPMEWSRLPLQKELGQLQSDDPRRGAALYLLKYLYELHGALPQMETLVEAQCNKMALDRITMRNLEILHPIERDRKTTLIHHLDRTKTAMGGRKLRHWLVEPLLDIEAIRARQDAVEELTKQPQELKKLQNLLLSIRDLERLSVRVCTDMASPRDVNGLKESILPLPKLKELIHSFSPWLLRNQGSAIGDLSQVASWIEEALVDEAPQRLGEGQTFKEGFNETLDELKQFQKKSNHFLQEFQAKIEQQYGMRKLKVGYNRIIGYYMEVPKSQSQWIPAHFQRKQSLVNQERFTSQELIDYEQKILLTTERIAKIESELFGALKEKINRFYQQLIATSEALATIDVIAALAETALLDQLVRPCLHEKPSLEIVEGRHFIVEKLAKQPFIANDTCLIDKRLMIITGPNMGGKSTYIRQVALICLLAQIGSFVPAKRAKLPLVDQIFTRIGAADNLAMGQSTFMVEMDQSAHILRHLTPKSLLILDEIGRGTATFDGIAIATSIIEYLASYRPLSPLVLFATHFYELTKLDQRGSLITNCHSQVVENQQDIIFLHKIQPGATDKSYGIQVAKLAGLPPEVVKNAQKHLESLENNNLVPNEQMRYLSSTKYPEIVEALLQLDIHGITPLELMQKVAALQQEYR